MNTIKYFSLLIAGTLLSTTVFAQNVTTPVAELDVKPVVAKPTASNIPAPGTRVVAPTPPEAMQSMEPLKPVAVETTAAIAAPSPLSRIDDATTNEIAKPGKIEAIAVPSVDAMQAKMTEQQKATMAGKTVRLKTIDQTTGVTESKLTPAIAIPIKAAPVLAPVVEN